VRAENCDAAIFCASESQALPRRGKITNCCSRFPWVRGGRGHTDRRYATRQAGVGSMQRLEAGAGIILREFFFIGVLSAFIRAVIIVLRISDIQAQTI